MHKIDPDVVYLYYYFHKMKSHVIQKSPMKNVLSRILNVYLSVLRINTSNMFYFVRTSLYVLRSFL